MTMVNGSLADGQTSHLSTAKPSEGESASASGCASRARPRSLAIPECEDDTRIRKLYRPFVLAKEDVERGEKEEGEEEEGRDWIGDLELDAAMDMAERNMQETGGQRLKILVLYGSLRQRFVVLSYLFPRRLVTTKKCLRFRLRD